MDRYFFEISYDGTAYSGWQRQKTATSVQQTIEDKLAILLQREVRIHGCGRTDAGVHASQYFFHLDLEADPKSIIFKLNKMLPKDIAILRFTKVDAKANAQKNAVSRTYEYKLTNNKKPFTHPFTTFVLDDIDMDKIKQALKIIEGRHDFKNFCKRPEMMDNTVCVIFSAELFVDEEKDVITITVSGNRFLHHMMRLLIGNLIKIGIGRQSLEEFQEFIDLKSSPEHFELAPAQGLVLSRVLYGAVN